MDAPPTTPSSDLPQVPDWLCQVPLLEQKDLREQYPTLAPEELWRLLASTAGSRAESGAVGPDRLPRGKEQSAPGLKETELWHGLYGRNNGILGSGEALALFQGHFLLFHILHHWKGPLARLGYHLEIYFLDTRLVPYPAPGHCRHWLERNSRFCLAPVEYPGTHCPRHRQEDGGELLFEPLGSFYRNPANYRALDQDHAEAFLRGGWKILQNAEKLEDYRRRLDLGTHFGLKELHSAYRRLAKEQHPDGGSQNPEAFLALQEAYICLREILVESQAIKGA